MAEKHSRKFSENPITGLPRKVHQGVDGVRLQTLVRLRWLAVVGQTVAVLSVYFLLGFPLPLAYSLALIALSAWLNIFLSIRWRASLRLDDRYATLLLAFDVCQLAGLLYLTGGLENPFSFLFLVPVTVCATTMPVWRTIALGALTMGLVTFLAIYHYPLPWIPGEEFSLPGLFLVGVWSSIACGLGFASVYSHRVSSEARDMSGALAATEFVLAQEQRLSALDGLAAAAAHELGTPLATIALVAKELKRDLPNSKDFAEDLDLLSSQTDRCREILSKLANRDEQREDMLSRLKLTVLLDELIEPFRAGIPEIVLDAQAETDGAPEPVVTRHPGIRYGLANLLENAVDFAKSKVTVEVRWSASDVVIVVIDDGPGISQEIIDRLGEPYVTTRKGYGSKQLASAPTKGHQGMGLGFFIAKTLLTRSGAIVALANLAHPQSGATIRISWPRDKIEPKDPGWSF